MTLQFNRCSMVAMISPDMLWPAVGVIVTLTVILCLRMMAIEMTRTIAWHHRYVEARHLRHNKQQAQQHRKQSLNQPPQQQPTASAAA